MDKHEEQSVDTEPKNENDGTILVKQFQVPLWVTQEWIDDHVYLQQVMNEQVSKGQG